MTDNLNIGINVSTGGSAANIRSVEQATNALNKALKNGDITAVQYAQGMARVEAAAKSAQGAIDSAAMASARTQKTLAEARFQQVKTDIALREADARATQRTEKAKRDAMTTTEANSKRLLAGKGIGTQGVSFEQYQAASNARIAKQESDALRQSTAATKAYAQEKTAAARSYEQYIKDSAKRMAEVEKAELKSVTAVAKREYQTQKAARKDALVDRNPGAASQLQPGYLATRALGGDAKNGVVGQDVGQLNQTRYALYDVATTLGVLGTALTGAGAAATVFGIKYETAFAQVQRTTTRAGGSTELIALRDQLIDLSETIPVSFEQLSSITALGAQLGIASENLAEFTETAAKYSAVTGVSGEQTAQSFGALGTLLNVAAADYDRLGSAINFAGVRSVATDQEILTLTTNIAASANQAGFAADEAVGLAAALASLRIAPEQARGVILRLFADFDRVTSEGGEQLKKYAAVLGVTAEQAQTLWETDAEGFFDKLLKGLSTADNLNSTLTSLGITETRESNVLQRLAGNYDIYTQSIQDATGAYAEGTFLTESYAIIAETAGAKIEVLLNSIQNLLAKAGEAFLPVLKPVIETLTAIVQGLDLLPAPILGAITGFTLLAGGLALVVAGGAALLASAFAMRTVLLGLQAQVPGTTGTLNILRAVIGQTSREMGLNAIAGRVMGTTLGSLTGLGRNAAVGISAASVSARGATGAFAGAAVAARGFGAALLATPVVNIIAGLSLLIPIILSIGDAMNQSSEASKELGQSLLTAGGGMESFIASLDKAGTGFRDITIGVSESSKEMAANAAEAAATSTVLDRMAGVQRDVDSNTRSSTEALKEQTAALGENSAQWILNALRQDAENNGLADIAGSPEQLELFRRAGIDIQQAIIDGANTNGGVQAALEKQLSDAAAAGKLAGVDADLATTGLDFTDNLDSIGLSVDALFNQLEVTGTINAALGIGAEGQSDIDITNAKLSALSDAVSNVFSGLNVEADFLDAMDALNASIQENGTSFNNLEVGGRANLAALQTALSSATAYGSQLGLSAEQSVAQALYAVNGQAIDTASLLQQLASVPAEFRAGLNIDDVISQYNKIAALGVGGGLTLAAQQSQVSALQKQRAALQKQQQTAGRGGGGGGGGASKKAQDSVKTLEEYVRDLGSAMKNAFDKRFGVSQAIDDVASKFNSMAKAAEDARNEVRDLNDELNELAADRAKLQAQLIVADDYGDTVRAQDIRAQLGKNTSKTGDTQAQLADATDRATLNLEGNTQAAIDNRNSITSLISAYQGQIEAYAATGASSAQLAAYTANLKGEFQTQLVQLGYNQSAVAQYATVFDTLTAAIAAVPLNKEVTVTANTGGAASNIASLSGQVAALDAQIDALNASIQDAKNKQSALAEKEARALKIRQQIAALEQRINVTNVSGPEKSALLLQLGNLQRQLAFGTYARGGVIGGGGRPVNRGQDDTLIYAQQGEGMVTQKSMEWLGSNGLDALNRQQNPFPQQIVVPQANSSSSAEMVVVELSAYDRAVQQKILERVGVTVGSETVARATNGSNKRYADRGTN